MFSEIADELTESVIEGPTPVLVKRENDSVLAGIPAIPNIMGYAYAKPKASATTVLTVEYVKASGNKVEVPLYAYWNYGNGRVSSFTSTLTGDWAQPWQAETSERFFENVLFTNTPGERIDYPYSIEVTYDGAFSEVEIIPVNLNPYATTDVTVTMPDGTVITERLTFDTTRYFYRFETPAQGRYLINVTYAYADKSFTSESAFHVGYSPEYNAFDVFDPAPLHAGIRNRGKVYEGSIPPIINDEKEVATYTVRYMIPLLIIAISLYVIDIIIRKLKWNDIRSFFGIQQKKGGRKA